MSHAPLSSLLRHGVLLFEGTPARPPVAPVRLPAELFEHDRADVLAYVEGLDEISARALSDAVWEHAVAAFPVVSPPVPAEEGGALWGTSGHALWLAGSRRGLHGIARRAGTGTAGAAIERALAVGPRPRYRVRLRAARLPDLHAPPDGPGSRDVLELSSCRIVGIVNVAHHRTLDDALRHAERMVDEGATMLDVSGDSAGPGTAPVTLGTPQTPGTEAEELERVVAVIEALAARLPVPLCVGTSRAAVAEAALSRGARIVNDASGLADARLAEAVASHDAVLILVHSRGGPHDAQQLNHYASPVVDVARELMQSAVRAADAGIPPERILLDPGLGFSKTPDQNLELLRHLPALLSLGFPLMVGASRKKFLGLLTGIDEPADRVIPSATAAAWSALQGAHMVRVHDVEATRQALNVIDGVNWRG